MTHDQLGAIAPAAKGAPSLTPTSLQAPSTSPSPLHCILRVHFPLPYIAHCHHEDGYSPRRGCAGLARRCRCPQDEASEGASLRAAGKSPHCRLVVATWSNSSRNTQTSRSTQRRSARSTWASSPRPTLSRSSRRPTSPTARTQCLSATS
jgi:hypothetical protein